MKNTSRIGSANILMLDIETAPAKVYTWSIWDVNIGLNQIIQDKYVLMWAAKWVGKSEVYTDNVSRHTTPDKYNTVGEKAIAKSVWALLDKADIVITHNGDSFDLKELNNTFIKHKLQPVSSFKSIDTKKIVKSNFRFTSMKLEFLVKKLEIGEKIDNGGFALWTGCMAGEKKSWDKMIFYCKRDAVLLEELYMQLRPFMKTHPNLSLYTDSINTAACPLCMSANIQKKGYAYTKLNKFQRYKCLNCGKDFRDANSLYSVSERKAIKRNMLC